MILQQPCQVSRLTFLKLGSADRVRSIDINKELSVSELIQQAKQGIYNLIEAFNKEETPLLPSAVSQIPHTLFRL